MKSSAVAFATTLKPAVSFACMVGGADETRRKISNGLIEGVSFPVKKVKLRMRKAPPRDTEGQIRKINAINALRRDGMNATLAADAVGVAYSTYRTWSNDHKIECNTNSRWDNR